MQAFGSVHCLVAVLSLQISRPQRGDGNAGGGGGHPQAVAALGASASDGADPGEAAAAAGATAAGAPAATTRGSRKQQQQQLHEQQLDQPQTPLTAADTTLPSAKYKNPEKELCPETSLASHSPRATRPSSSPQTQLLAHDPSSPLSPSYTSAHPPDCLPLTPDLLFDPVDVVQDFDTDPFESCARRFRGSDVRPEVREILAFEQLKVPEFQTQTVAMATVEPATAADETDEADASAVSALRVETPSQSQLTMFQFILAGVYSMLLRAILSPVRTRPRSPRIAEEDPD